ncbi:Testis-Expressed Protein 9 [Manis pentadactyla]|nr:Testis-Expressed Protein 9 [Manis pentadactyla]
MTALLLSFPKKSHNAYPIPTMIVFQVFHVISHTTPVIKVSNKSDTFEYIIFSCLNYTTSPVSQTVTPKRKALGKVTFSRSHRTNTEKELKYADVKSSVEQVSC